MKRDKLAKRNGRRERIRRRVKGSESRPRLSVFRSNKYIYAQVIDDERGVTLSAASSLEKALQDGLEGKFSTLQAAQKVGQQVAERAKSKGVTRVAFDRGGYKYHGRVRALADAAREAGLEF